MIEVEICINCDGQQNIIDAVGAAYYGGAARVELCGAMHLDGLTPKNGQIISARSAFINKSGLMVMIRPRSGNFCYSSKEIDLMMQQIHMAAEAGADGIVIGVLKPEDNCLNIDLLYKLLGLGSQYNFTVTFHRAFDATPDPFETMELLIQLGVDRILTSGTRWGEKGLANDGIDNLKQIIEESRGRIEIVIAGGINSKNVNNIIHNLPFSGNKISVHSYTGVQENGITKIESVKSLVNEVQRVQ